LFELTGERVFGAGPVLRGDPTEVHAPKSRRISGWSLMRGKRFCTRGEAGLGGAPTDRSSSEG
jgi:hypothetical protein